MQARTCSSLADRNTCASVYAAALGVRKQLLRRASDAEGFRMHSSAASSSVWYQQASLWMLLGDGWPGYRVVWCAQLTRREAIGGGGLARRTMDYGDGTL